MVGEELFRASIGKLRRLLDQREISAPELAEYFLDRMQRHNGTLNCYITVTEEQAMEMARRAQRKIDQGDVRIWTGIPLSVKDNISTKGIKTTCGSRMLESYVPVYDATIISKLRRYGAVLLGKTNMDPFGMGNTCRTSHFGPVQNPVSSGRIPGGSSGGAAACVAAGLCAGALASDTGGSIRQPAAFCGVTGLKPTYGTVPRYGLIAFASSLDQIGPIAASAEDCGYLLDAITDYDPNDSTMRQPNCYGYTGKVGASLKGVKIGVPAVLLEKAEPAVQAAVLDAVEFYKDAGCKCVPVSLPGRSYALSAYYIISSAEAASNLSRFDGIRFGSRGEGETCTEQMKSSRGNGFEPEVKRRILLGNYVLSAGYREEYYQKATAARNRIKAELENALQACDFLLSPTLPFTAPRVGVLEGDLIRRYEADAYTVLANLSGLPAVTTPCGYDGDGLPIGLSLTGRAFDEASILGAAAAFEAQFTRREAAAL